MKMTAELTAEEIVTNLLSSHQILKRQKENFYITNPHNLGDFLKNAPETASIEDVEPTITEKYTFIKSKWSI